MRKVLTYMIVCLMMPLSMISFAYGDNGTTSTSQYTISGDNIIINEDEDDFLTQGQKNGAVTALLGEIMLYSGILVDAVFYRSYQYSDKDIDSYYSNEGILRTDNRVMVLYVQDKNMAKVIAGESVALTSDDINEIEAAFEKKDIESGFSRVLFGLKTLMIKIFKNGEYDYPELSYIREFLIDQDSTPNLAEVPVGVYFDGSFPSHADSEIEYLLNEISVNTGMIIYVSTRADENEGGSIDFLHNMYRNPDNTVSIMYTRDSNTAEMIVGKNFSDVFTEEDIDKIKLVLTSDTNKTYSEKTLDAIKSMAVMIFKDGDFSLSDYSGVNLLLEQGKKAVHLVLYILVSAAFIVVFIVALVVLKKKRKSM